MTRVLICMLLLLTASTCKATETQADFFVSASGSDSWSGTLATPNMQGSDGPFATLERARDAVRELKKKKSADIVALLREGTYPLAKTVVFGLADSGEGDSTVTYAAYSAETPVFSSGREIKGWKKVSGELPGLPKEAWGKVWMADVSDRFFTLYDAEGMLPRAHSCLQQSHSSHGRNLSAFARHYDLVEWRESCGEQLDPSYALLRNDCFRLHDAFL